MFACWLFSFSWDVFTLLTDFSVACGRFHLLPRRSLACSGLHLLAHIHRIATDHIAISQQDASHCSSSSVNCEGSHFAACYSTRICLTLSDLWKFKLRTAIFYRLMIDNAYWFIFCCYSTQFKLQYLCERYRICYMADICYRVSSDLQWLASTYPS